MKTRTLTLCLSLAVGLTLALAIGCSKTVARTDAQIASEAQNKIYSDAAVQSRDITVQSVNGVVTLAGDVNGEAERVAAANDAAAIEGVKTVVNNLQVKQAQAAPPPAAPAPEPGRPRSRSTVGSHSRRASTASHHKSAEPAPAMDATSPVAESTPPVQNTPPAPVIPAAQTAPPPPPRPVKVTIPAGTQLTVRLNDPLDSERNQVGDAFHGTLSSPIVLDGETAVPNGVDVVGRVAAVQSAGRFAGNSVLTLELTSLSVNDKTYNLQTNQWSRAGKGEGKNTATKVGVGTAAGAVLGGIIGGGKGAAIGAATGAGAGTGVAAAKKGEQIKLSPEALLNFQLINPLTVVQQATNDRNAGRQPLD